MLVLKCLFVTSSNRVPVYTDFATAEVTEIAPPRSCTRLGRAHQRAPLGVERELRTLREHKEEEQRGETRQRLGGNVNLGERVVDARGLEEAIQLAEQRIGLCEKPKHIIANVEFRRKEWSQR